VTRSALAAEGEEKSGIRATRFKSKDYMDDTSSGRKVLKAERRAAEGRSEEAKRATFPSILRRTCCSSSSNMHP